MLDWWIQEDNLVLDADLMYDRRQDQLAFRGLESRRLAGIAAQCMGTNLLVLGALVSTLVEGDELSSFLIVRPFELIAPLLNDMCHSLKENAFYPLIKLRYPMIEVGITLQVQSVDLYSNNESTETDAAGGIILTAAWILPKSSRNASAAYGHVESSSMDRRISL